MKPANASHPHTVLGCCGRAAGAVNLTSTLLIVSFEILDKLRSFFSLQPTSTKIKAISHDYKFTLHPSPRISIFDAPFQNNKLPHFCASAQVGVRRVWHARALRPCGEATAWRGRRRRRYRRRRAVPRGVHPSGPGTMNWIRCSRCSRSPPYPTSVRRPRPRASREQSDRQG